MPAAGCDTGTDGNDVISTITMCKHKRGGMCITHGTKGTKVMESVKVWSKKKDGLFGYVWKTRTKYVCQDSGVAKPGEQVSRYCGVAKSNDGSIDKGPGVKTIIDEALGGDSDSNGQLSGVCGADYRRAVSIQGESLQISGEDKESG